MAAMPGIWKVALGAALLTAACGPGGGDDPDAGDGPDGGGGNGLTFEWRAPDVDQALPAGVTIDKLVLKLRDLRAVGDAAGNETHLESQQIELDSPTKVGTTTFPQAPPGIYSAFEFRVDRGFDGEGSWQVEGTVDLGGDTVNFLIEDEGTASVSLDLAGLDLPPGEGRTVAIDVDLAAVVDGIDWASLPQQSGQIVIEEDSTLIGQLRGRLITSFSIASID
ncbi:MAG: hypothetical protein H6708_10195 [Kofleriaceae bacterium]|nr:hypothetical protein [Kofleriaceae bacterium]